MKNSKLVQLTMSSQPTTPLISILSYFTNNISNVQPLLQHHPKYHENKYGLVIFIHHNCKHIIFSKLEKKIVVNKIFKWSNYLTESNTISHMCTSRRLLLSFQTFSHFSICREMNASYWSLLYKHAEIFRKSFEHYSSLFNT